MGMSWWAGDDPILYMDFVLIEQECGIDVISIFQLSNVESPTDQSMPN